jgi:pilus assembly protein Flp/PilA
MQRDSTFLFSRGDFPAVPANNPVNVSPVAGVEFLAKIDILLVSSESDPQAKNSIRKESTMLFAPKEKGQGLVEYAIILALVAIVVIAVMRLLGPKIGNTFSTISNSLP